MVGYPLAHRSNQHMKRPLFAPSYWVYVFTVLLLLDAPAAHGQGYILDDANRFEKLFRASSGELTAAAIQEHYIEPGSKGIEIFTPFRIQNAENLANYIEGNREIYEKALTVCLPAARQADTHVANVLDSIKTMLGQTQSAPAYILFGAGNSGGTASTDGLVIGLEVICKLSDTERQAQATIQEFVAHEIVHVYQ